MLPALLKLDHASCGPKEGDSAAQTTSINMSKNPETARKSSSMQDAISADVWMARNGAQKNPQENRMEGVIHKMFISFLLIPCSPGEIRSWGFTINKQFQSKIATSLVLKFPAYFAICFMQHLAFRASIVLWQDPFVRLSISSPSSTLLPTDEVVPCQVAGYF